MSGHSKPTLVVLAAIVVGASVVVTSDQPVTGPLALPVTEAPSSALAMSAAQRQGVQVEALDQRTENRAVFAQPDGTMLAELNLTPKRVRKAGQWVTADPTLERSPDGLVVPKGTVPGIALSGGGEQTPLVQLTRDDKTFTLTWPGALPNPVVDGNVATYENVLPDVDLKMATTVSGYEQYLVVKTPEAAKNPALKRIRFGLTSANLVVKAGTDGSLSATDAQGGTVFESGPSLMWDSTPQPGDAPPQGRAPVGVEVTDDSLTLVPDEKKLTDPNAVFPIVIDPSMHTPDKQDWTSVYDDGSHAMREGTHWNGEYSHAETAPWLSGITTARAGKAYQQHLWVRSYFQFDTDFLAGRQILSSKFITAAVYGPTGCGSSHRAELFDAGEISRATNWNNQPAEGGLGTTLVGSVQHDCTGYQDVVFEHAAPGTNAGGKSTFYLNASDPNDDNAWRKYHPDLTKLSVHYNARPELARGHTLNPAPRSCRWCGDFRWTSGPSLDMSAILSDPDDSSMRAEWRIYGPKGWPETRLSNFQSTQSPFSTPLDVSGYGDEAVVHWHVRATDGHAWAPAVTPGESFKVDTNKPTTAPVVSSPLYPEDNRWHGGVGVPGRFEFKNAARDKDGNLVDKDVDRYAYGWDDSTSLSVDADKLGGDASVTLEPTGDGPRDLYVRTVDRAGNMGPLRVYHFYVRAGNGPVAQYTLDGNVKDTAYLGSRDGTLHGSASYTPGALGSALLFNGSDARASAPKAVDTAASFSVSAWVRLDRLASTWDVAVSQDGSATCGYCLRYQADQQRWAFVMPSSDSVSPTGHAVALSKEAPVAGEWTHLTGVHDAETKEVRLYVNGAPGNSGGKPTGWSAPGDLRIGQAKPRADWTGDPWHGAIDEVRLYDRAMSEAEVRAAVRTDNVQAGHWKFDDELSNGTAQNEVQGGEQLVLSDGAAFSKDDAALQNAVKGTVTFDGVQGHAQSSGPVVRTDRSFSVAGWVKLDGLAPTGKSYTVLSQDGTASSGFVVRQRDGKWQFGMAEADGSTSWNLLTTSVANATTDWTHLTAVFDAPAKKGYLYVDGGTPKEAVGAKPLWDAAGKLTFGRAQRSGNADFLKGKLDDWRIYTRVLTIEEIRGIVAQDGVTAGTWKLDGDVKDTSGQSEDGTVEGSVTWGPGQTSSPDPTDLAVRLGGTERVSARKTIDTSRSFSVAVWAKLDRVGGHLAIVSLDGRQADAFALQVTPEGNWAFAMSETDTAGAKVLRAVGGQAQTGVWTHLVAGYDHVSKQMSLYVNGVAAGTAQNTIAWNNEGLGRLWIGRSKTGVFPGVVDDVSVYTRPLFADEIRQMSGRDLSLVHEWQLDESSGTTVSDSIGTRSGTLGGGATFGPGRSGNAVAFDGSGAVSTTGVDLRSDESFTVSAWVFLTGTECASDECKMTAVSLDGDRNSKFRLGHVIDDDRRPYGAWMFEMPTSGADNAATATVTTTSRQLNKWVHLVGVYESNTKKIWLYVDSKHIGDSTLNTPWHASGGLQVGRGRVGAQSAEFWAGRVDEVRLYAGALDETRVSALGNSYPAESPASILPNADKGHWKFDEFSGTTAADSSGRGLTATLKGGTGWIGGRAAAAAWLDGTGGYAETVSSVLQDTTRSYSVSAWAYLTQGDGDRVVVGQDGSRVSTFTLGYDAQSRKWAVRLADEDKDNPGTTLLLSADPATLQDWTHLVVAYDAGHHQLRLYVNGEPSGTLVGANSQASTGPLSIGRGKWNGANSAFFPRGIDDVRVFGTALTDGEVRKVHDDVPSTLSGQWRFDDGTVRDHSWRNNPTKTYGTGTSTFVDGVNGKALRLDGSSYAATDWFGVSMRDSFTVSAWARIERADKVATVVGQDGTRMSGFALQYRPEANRWAFSASTRDSEAAPMVWAASTEPPKINQWQHLTGVYDRPAGLLKLYVDGQLVGTRDKVALWTTKDRMSIGRGKVAGKDADLFTGAIDEVQIENGVAAEQDIATRASYPVPAQGQLGRFLNGKGDRYTASTSQPVPAGYHLEGTLGSLVDPSQPNAKTLYACRYLDDAFTSSDANCEGRTKLGIAGVVYGKQPTNLSTVSLYRCNTGTDRFETRRSDCEGATNEGILGYTVAYAPLVRYYNNDTGDHAATVDGIPPAYYSESTLGYLSLVARTGDQPLMACYDGSDQFVSTDVNCDGKRVVGSLGRIWTQAPADAPNRAIYRCRYNNQFFVSVLANCEGQAVDRLLGYVEKAVPATVPVFPAVSASPPTG